MSKPKLKTERDRLMSEMQKKLNIANNMSDILRRKNETRKLQQKRSHDFDYLFREMFPEEHKKVCEEYKKRFPENQERIL